MSAADIIALVGVILTLAAMIYKAGADRERFANSDKQSKQWADGLGGVVRSNNERQERRWMLQLADDVEGAESNEKRKQVATRIREEIWRK